MTDVVTSESSDGNFSSSINATATETGTGSLAGRVAGANPVIVRVTILLVMGVLNVGGNGFTLATIRLTPRLWTKTNFILASMMVSDIIMGVFMFWYTPFLIFVYVFNNPCEYNVVITAVASLYKITAYVSTYHLILISVERYIAIVYPLHYETKFTDRTVKWAISACWVIGILMSMTFSLWLINADLRKCVLIPVQYNLLALVASYLPVCVSLFTCYGKIFAISRRHRQLVEPMNASIPATQVSGHATTNISAASTQSNTAGNIADTKQTSLAWTGPPANPGTSSCSASAELAQQQQQQQIKSRRRAFKAVYLTAAIVGAFVILWFPSMLGRVLASVGYDRMVVNYLLLAGGAIGACNFAFSWAIYAAVSKSYRRAYRQMLVRIGFCCCKNVTPAADNSLVV